MFFALSVRVKSPMKCEAKLNEMRRQLRVPGGCCLMQMVLKQPAEKFTLFRLAYLSNK